MKKLIITFLLILSTAEIFGKTRLHCFSLSGKVYNKKNGELIKDSFLIVHVLNSSDTIRIDLKGNYNYKYSFYPPCKRLHRRKFYKKLTAIEISHSDQKIIIKIPRNQITVCDSGFSEENIKTIIILKNLKI